MRKILDTRLTQEQLAQIGGYLEAKMVAQAGLEALHLGLTQTRPRDTLAALRVQEQLAAAGDEESLEEMRFELDAFIAAVQEVVPPQEFEQVIETFVTNRAKAAELTDWNDRERLLHPPTRQRPPGT